MKLTQIIILSLSVLVSGTLLYVHYEIDKVQMDMQQSQIDHLKKTNEAQRDSLEKRLELTRDSLIVALEGIEIAHIERLKAEALALQARKYYYMIKFITHSDSSRTAELINLYPSFKPLQK